MACKGCGQRYRMGNMSMQKKPLGTLSPANLQTKFVPNRKLNVDRGIGKVHVQPQPEKGVVVTPPIMPKNTYEIHLPEDKKPQQTPLYGGDSE